MARYRLHNLVVETVVGVHLHERTRRQAIHIDVEFTANAMTAAASDSLGDCVDYETLAERIRGELRKTDYELLNPDSLDEWISLSLLSSWGKEI